MIRNVSDKSMANEESVKVEPKFDFEHGLRKLNRKISQLTEDKDNVNLGGDNEILVVRKVNVMEKKDFIEEYRCQRDVQLLSADVNVILDSKRTNLSDLISDMLKVHFYQNL